MNIHICNEISVACQKSMSWLQYQTLLHDVLGMMKVISENLFVYIVHEHVSTTIQLFKNVMSFSQDGAINPIFVMSSCYLLGNFKFSSLPLLYKQYNY